MKIILKIMMSKLANITKFRELHNSYTLYARKKQSNFDGDSLKPLAHF